MQVVTKFRKRGANDVRDVAFGGPGLSASWRGNDPKIITLTAYVVVQGDDYDEHVLAAVLMMSAEEARRLAQRLVEMAEAPRL